MLGRKKFFEDVIKGLQSKQKHLLSKYLYDAKGDELFEKIMRSKEYYLSKCELEIFKRQRETIADAVTEKGEKLDIIALGPGDLSKTIYLIRELAKRDKIEQCFPIDISSHVIQSLEPKFKKEFPKIAFHGLAGDYFEQLPVALKNSQNRRLVFFVGATIGNFLPDEMLRFCKKLRRNLRKGDRVLIGIDLKKDPRKILAAYNDKEGYTAQFNLNLLKRINKELDANFDLRKFVHFPSYSPLSGACRSFLISTSNQEVSVGRHGIKFKEGETIYMEVSQKYDLDEIKEVAKKCGYQQKTYFLDSKEYFVDVIWEV